MCHIRLNIGDRKETNISYLLAYDIKPAISAMCNIAVFVHRQ